MMKTYTIRIELENAAFDPGGGYDPEQAAALEVARILEGIIQHVKSWEYLPVKPLLDVNGNRAGRAGYNAAGLAFYCEGKGEPL